MDIVVLLTLLGIVSSTAVSFYILHGTLFENLSKRFFLLGMLFVIWGMGILLRYDAQTERMAYFSFLLSLLGASFVPAAAFEFSQQFLRERLKPLQKVTWFIPVKNAIWVLNGLAYATAPTSFVYQGAFFKDGHCYIKHGLLNFVIMGTNTILILLTSLMVTYYAKFKFLNSRHKKQAYIIASAPLAPALIIFLVEIYYAISKVEIFVPYGVICLYLLVMAIGIIKFNLIQITPENSATNIIKYLPDGLVICNHEGIIMHVNPAFLKNFDANSEKIINKSIAEVVFADKELRDNKLTEILKESLTLKNKLYLKTGKDEEPPLFGVTTKALVDDDEYNIGYIMVFRDLRPIMNLQMGLEHSLKMANLGEIVAGVAHEINNPLAIINGYTEIMKTSLQKGKIDKLEIGDVIEVIKKSSDRIASIVSHLKTYSNPDEKKVVVKAVDICAAINSTLGLITSIYHSEDIRFINKLPHASIYVEGNLGYLQQVFMNIFSNAKDSFSKKGGTITISERVTNGWVTIDIKDNGCGIAEKNLNRIFDAFFTTKPSRKGVGLGLSLSLTMMEEIGGSISVASKEGEGSCFSLVFKESKRIY